MKCFDHHKQNNKICGNKKCKFWINTKKFKNCCLIAADNTENEKLTLQEIGEIFNVTRMRICQIEKNAIKKIKEKFSLIF